MREVLAGGIERVIDLERSGVFVSVPVTLTLPLLVGLPLK